jgi:preprotein translocase subunit SecA
MRQLDFEGVEPLRQLILDGPLDPEMRGLREDFLTACTLMEVRFPEFEQWTEDAKHDREANKTFFAERSSGLAAPVPGKGAEILDDEMEEEAEEPIRERVGRNEPCPCGSGKKFKKCCLKKQGGKVFE